MVDCNPSQTQMEARVQLVKKSEGVVVDATEFRSVVGIEVSCAYSTRPSTLYELC
jgi:hypothetical protein